MGPRCAVDPQWLLLRAFRLDRLAYNFTDNGGFERPAYFEQETGPGLIFIEGGTYTMGQVDDDLNYAWDNIPDASASRLYMDETEVTNSILVGVPVVAPTHLWFLLS